RLDVIAVPRSALGNVADCHVSMMKGWRLQHIRFQKLKDHLPVCVSVWHTFQWTRPFQLPRASMEACSAALLYGRKRTQLLQDIKQGLNEHMMEFQNWGHAGDVDSINAGLLHIICDCAAKVLQSSPGYEESNELKVTRGNRLS
ncbi:unnamed protein product, partial [Prorocentrum cordatum]